MDFKPGSRWRSAVCDTEGVLVRPPSELVCLQCGGVEMIAHATARDPAAAPLPGFDTGSLLGKRYTDEACGIEVLCTKAGAGTLAVDGRPLTIKEAKKLPSSD